jgi:hypothetical protein
MSLVWAFLLGFVPFFLMTSVVFLPWRRVPSPRHAVRMSRPSKPRPDYRLIWDLEEELGFEHLDSEKRPLRSWMSHQVQEPVILEMERQFAKQDALAAMEPSELMQHRAMAGERARAEMTRKREQDLLSSIDRSLRESGERGFL